DAESEPSDELEEYREHLQKGGLVPYPGWKSGDFQDEESAQLAAEIPDVSKMKPDPTDPGDAYKPKKPGKESENVIDKRQLGGEIEDYDLPEGEAIEQMPPTADSDAVRKNAYKVGRYKTEQQVREGERQQQHEKEEYPYAAEDEDEFHRRFGKRIED